jgi:hypothetical protein
LGSLLEVATDLFRLAFQKPLKLPRKKTTQIKKTKKLLLLLLQLAPCKTIATITLTKHLNLDTS